MHGRKYVTTETLAELAKFVLKNNISQFNGKTLKQLKRTSIGTTFTPPSYAIVFMKDLGKRSLGDIEQ